MFSLVLLTSSALVSTCGRRWVEKQKNGLVTGASFFFSPCLALRAPLKMPRKATVKKNYYENI